MKMTALFAILTAAIISVSYSAVAAPVESVESSRASTARQKVDAFLAEKVVARQFAALGISQQQIHTRLARLSDSQLQQLAAQVDLLRAGGMIEGGGLHPAGPFSYMAQTLGTFFYNVYQLLFAWGDLK